ncbi:MAG: ribosome biogenesis GTP-binding protein YihA/YsxC [Acetivibrionales bacterium]
MIVNNARYELTAVKPEQYPQRELPEIVFVGRSNVGKSSLINTLLNRKNLARVGTTPGKTRQINFYNVDDRLYFVDLPGYGYASVSKSEKTSWGKLVDTYLDTRSQLKLIIMLVDIRHEPSEMDKTMYEWILCRGLPHIIAATKADKINRSQVRNRIDGIRKALKTDENTIIVPFSSSKRTGKDELWDIIDELIGLKNA